MVNYWDKYTEMHGQQNIKKKSCSSCYEIRRQMFEETLEFEVRT